MSLSPTQRHYIISFTAGCFLAASAAIVDLLSVGAPIEGWQPVLAAVMGGVVLFARDWLHNNTGAFLEGTTAGVVASGVTSSGVDPGLPVSLPPH